MIPLAIAQSAEKEVLVIALDSLASAKLRERNIAHQTPVRFLNLSGDDDEFTNKAVTFAKTWYQPFGDSLWYDGVSLGEVVEYDFCFLFNDALRSIEIARKIMEQFSPDEIVLPYKTTFDMPPMVCYEALAPALSHLASLNGIKTSVIRLDPMDKLAALTTSSKERLASFFYNEKERLASFFYNAAGQTRALLSKKSTKNDTHKKKILLPIPSAHTIEREIDNNNAICYPTDLTTLTGRRPKKLTKDLTSIWEDFTKSPSFVTSLKYKDVPLYRVLERRFINYFSFRLPLLAKLCENMQKNIKTLNPDILVLMEDVTPPIRLLSKICKGQGIPVLVLQHGAVAGDIGGFHVMPLEADKQAVWGEIPQEWHVKRGKDIESQVITGNYRFDPIARGYAVNREEVYRQLGIDSNKGVIVFGTDWYTGFSVSYTWEMNEDFIRQALEALVPYRDMQIVVKLHPTRHQEYSKIVAEIANEVGLEVILTKDYLWELLSICDLLICGNSTIGMEAMFFAKPVILVNLYNIPEIPYEAYQAALGVRNPGDFRSAIDLALHDPKVRAELELNQKRFLEGYTYKRDGQASNRVACLIMEMVS